MQIQKTMCSEILENQVNRILDEYEEAYDISCNYQPFCFIAAENETTYGILTGYTCFSEVYIDDLAVEEACRRRGIGSALVAAVEEYFRDHGFDNINLCTNAFQAPGFYEKCGFTLEFVRCNRIDPKLDKYFYVKYF